MNAPLPEVSGPSDRALAQVGKPIKWTQTEPVRRKAEGICVGVRRSPGVTMVTDEGEYPAVQFCIEDKRTGRMVWTCNFADVPESDDPGSLDG